MQTHTRQRNMHAPAQITAHQRTDETLCEHPQMGPAKAIGNSPRIANTRSLELLEDSLINRHPSNARDLQGKQCCGYISWETLSII
jgi:hypothetical protein